MFFVRRVIPLIRIFIKPRFAEKKTRFCTTNAGVSNNSVTISPNDQATYDHDGVVCLRRVFSQDWITKVQRGIQKARDYPSKMARAIPSHDDGQFVYFLDYNNCNRISEFRDFIFNSPAAELAGKFMRSEKSIFYYDNIFAKDPKTSRPTPWHQDQTYYPLEGFQPGDCILFHLMCVHGFPTSVDYEGRQVLSTRWVGEEVTFGTRPWNVDATLMKGDSKPGEYIYHSEKDYPTVWQSS